MAVHFRPDKFVPPEPVIEEPEYDDDDDGGGFGEGLAVAARSSVISLVIGAVLLFITIKLMRKAVLAADNLLHKGQGDFWMEMLMPSVLFAIFGALFGAAVAWRVSARTSLGGGLMCCAAGAIGLLLAVTGAISGTIVFGAAVPLMFWLCLGALTLAAIGGAFGYTIWT